jgi:hypothetical protein
MNSLPPDQRTITTPVEDGVLREPIPGMEVCDFCAATPVEFAFPCGRHVGRLGRVHQLPRDDRDERP